MESRKIVLLNLFSGQQWRYRHREQTYGTGGGGREGWTNGESSMDAYTLPYVKLIVSANLLYDLGTQTGAP